MANNCLVTKLKGVVDNDNLPYFNAYNIVVDDWAGFTDGRLVLCRFGATAYTVGGVGVTVKVLSNGAIYHGDNILDGTELTLPEIDATRFIKPNDNSKPTVVLLVGLDKIESVTFAGNDFFKTHTEYLKETAYMPNLNPLYVSQNEDKVLCLPLSSVDGSVLTDIGFIKKLPASKTDADAIAIPSSSGISGKNWYTGDISAFADLVNLKSVDIYDIADISGNIASVGGLTELESLLLYGTDVEGTVESFVTAQVAAGRTTGVVKRFSTNGKISFEGTMLSAGHHNIQWNGTNDITVGDEYLPD